jgi:hypothetical protein
MFEMRKIAIILIFLCAVGVATCLSVTATAEESIVPSWVKNSAKWWSDGQVSDSEFLDAVKYLINQKIIRIENHSESKIDSVVLPSVFTDKQTYQMGEEIEISGSGFENGTVGLLVNDDRFGLYLDNAKNPLSYSAVEELGDIFKYPIPEPPLDLDQWKTTNFDTYGNILKSNVKVNESGTWKATLKTSELTKGHYEIRVGQKIYNGYDLLSNSTQTFLLKTAKTGFFIES